MIEGIGNTGLIMLDGDVFVDDRGELRFINDFNFDKLKTIVRIL